MTLRWISFVPGVDGARRARTGSPSSTRRRCSLRARPRRAPRSHPSRRSAVSCRRTSSSDQKILFRLASGADGARRRRGARRLERVEAIGLGVHPRAARPRRAGRARSPLAGLVQVDEARRGGGEAPGASQRQAALGARGGHGDVPALVAPCRARRGRGRRRRRGRPRRSPRRRRGGRTGRTVTPGARSGTRK